MTGCVFRFGNVVGPRQTHGVGFDFLRQLLEHPTKLRILGDGTQSKSYIHVSDVTAAVLHVNNTSAKMFCTQNVATGDYITVREIAHLAVECAGINPDEIEFEYTGGNRGWKGDVPIVRLNTDRIRQQGWSCSRNSREALRHAMLSMLEDARSGRLYANRDAASIAAGAVGTDSR
jgi:UDP-glucose 4-epimerase